MGVREQNKQARKDRILAAAAELLAEGGAEALTMRELASAAGLSEATPYNLFGSKAGVVEALFQAEMTTIVARSFEHTPSDPIERLFVSTEMLAETWASESGVFRELIRCARESGADLARFSELPTSLLRAGLTDARAAGAITDAVPLADVARHVFLSNQGAYEPWISGQTDDATLRRDLIVGLSLSLLSVATPETRKRILERLSTA